ncbi:MAG: MlaE family ABC transporter permease [Desulfatibacillaceae bacterium]
MRYAGTLQNSAGATGRAAIQVVDHTLGLCAYAMALFRHLARRSPRGRKLSRRIVVEQLYYTGVQALPIVIPVSLLLGALVIMQFSRLDVPYDFGRVIVVLLVRETGPLLTALVVLLRSGVAMVVELSYMQTLGEVEALEMSGIDPVKMLGLPRILGITAAMVCLYIVFEVSAMIGGSVVAWSLSGTASLGFYESAGNAMTLADIGVGFFKVACFGVILCVVATYRGFTVPRSITAIPSAASRAAIEALLYILAVNAVVTVIMLA